MTQNKKLNFKIGLLAILTLLVFGIGCVLAYTTNANKVYADSLVESVTLNYNDTSSFEGNSTLNLSIPSSGWGNYNDMLSNVSSSYSSLDPTHSYFVRFFIQNISNTSSISIYSNSYSYVFSVNTSYSFDSPYTTIITGWSSLSLFRVYGTASSTASFRVYCDFIDLTAMYGSSDIPTKAEFISQFPTFTDYTESTLITLYSNVSYDGAGESYNSGYSQALSDYNYLNFNNLNSVNCFELDNFSYGSWKGFSTGGLTSYYDFYNNIVVKIDNEDLADAGASYYYVGGFGFYFGVFIPAGSIIDFSFESLPECYIAFYNSSSKQFVGELYNSSEVGSLYDGIYYERHYYYTNSLSFDTVYFITPSLTNDNNNFAYFSDLGFDIMYYNDSSLSTDTYSAGYDKGQTDGLSTGYSNGYSAGYAYGLESADTATFQSLFAAIIDAPVNVIASALDFDLLGINLKTFFFSLFTVALVITIIRIFI